MDMASKLFTFTFTFTPNDVYDVSKCIPPIKVAAWAVTAVMLAQRMAGRRRCMLYNRHGAMWERRISMCVAEIKLLLRRNGSHFCSIAQLVAVPGV